MRQLSVFTILFEVVLAYLNTMIPLHSTTRLVWRYMYGHFNNTAHCYNVCFYKQKILFLLLRIAKKEKKNFHFKAYAWRRINVEVDNHYRMHALL